MLAELKSLFQRPLSEADLLRVAEGLIQRPPMTPDTYDLLVGMRGTADGASVIELWRREFRTMIATIGAEKTWGLQRSALLREIVENFTWTALWHAAQNVQHPEAWSGALQDAFPQMCNASPDACRSVLTQRWLMAVSTDAGLRTLAERLYAVEEMKQGELGFVELCHTRLQTDQVALRDRILMVTQDEPEAGAALTAWHDTEVVSILNDEWKFLDTIEDAVVTGSLDLERTREKVAALEARRAAAARLIMSPE